ncbi:MAG: membrane protein insertion efficiency factor YidD [Phycisphaeraceae bacterium]
MRRLIARFLIFLVVVYRVTLAPVMGGHCRFMPSCSQYMIDAIEKHGPYRGAWRGLKRIGRCHPFGGSGHDPA